MFPCVPLGQAHSTLQPPPPLLMLITILLFHPPGWSVNIPSYSPSPTFIWVFKSLLWFSIPYFLILPDKSLPSVYWRFPKAMSHTLLATIRHMRAYNILSFCTISVTRTFSAVHILNTLFIQWYTTTAAYMLKTMVGSGYPCMNTLSAVKSSPWKTPDIITSLCNSQYPFDKLMAYGPIPYPNNSHIYYSSLYTYGIGGC